MTEVTYYVALPFVAADNGFAAGEPTECFNPNAAVMRAEALSREKVTSAQSPLAALVTLLPAISASGNSATCRMISVRYDPSIHLR
jgi:hypothetical protein